jgi:heme A synthase
MDPLDPDFWTGAALHWLAAGLLLALAVFAAWAEHRRSKRPNLDRPGVMPWHLIQILAAIGALAAAAIALKG